MSAHDSGNDENNSDIDSIGKLTNQKEDNLFIESVTFNENEQTEKVKESIEELMEVIDSFDIKDCDTSVSNSADIKELKLSDDEESPVNSTMEIRMEKEKGNEINDIEKVLKNEEKAIANNTDETSKSIKKFDIQAAPESVCDICSKRVYPMERLLMDSKCYHKACFKCCICGKALNPTVVTKSNNNIFCKPHYIELFRKRGRYDDIDLKTEEKQDINNRTVTSSSNITKKEDSNLNEMKIERIINTNSGDETSQSVESNNRVADVTKAWKGRELNSGDWKKDDSNNRSQVNELQSVNNTAKVKNLTALFESNQ